MKEYKVVSGDFMSDLVKALREVAERHSVDEAFAMLSALQVAEMALLHLGIDPKGVTWAMATSREEAEMLGKGVVEAAEMPHSKVN